MNVQANVNKVIGSIGSTAKNVKEIKKDLYKQIAEEKLDEVKFKASIAQEGISTMKGAMNPTMNMEGKNSPVEGEYISEEVIE